MVLKREEEGDDTNTFEDAIAITKICCSCLMIDELWSMTARESRAPLLSASWELTVFVADVVGKCSSSAQRNVSMLR